MFRVQGISSLGFGVFCGQGTIKTRTVEQKIRTGRQIIRKNIGKGIFIVGIYIPMGYRVQEVYGF